MIFYLLSSSFFFSDPTLYKEDSCFIRFILSLCSNTLTLESVFEYIRQKLKKHDHLKISSRDEVFTRLFVFFSSQDENSSLSSLSKRQGWNFIPGWKKKTRHVDTSSRYEILKWACFFFNFWRMYSNMLPKVNVFEHNESMNLMKHKASL